MQHHMYGSQGWLASCRGGRKILFLTFRLRTSLGVAHSFSLWRVALRCSPRTGGWMPGKTVRCVLGQYAGTCLKRPVAPPFPHLHLSTGCALTGNAVNCHNFSRQDRKTNGHVLKGTGSLGSSEPRLSQLAFRFTCNHDNSADASCQGTQFNLDQIV